MRARGLAVLVMALAVPALMADDKMPWAKNWASAKKAAADKNKLVMLDFSTSW